MDNPNQNPTDDLSNLLTTTVTWQYADKTLIGYLSFDKTIEGKRPGILVVPEWWGLTEYTKSRTRQLASLGYIALALDMYGNGEVAQDPTKAQELATPFYKDATLAKPMIDTAIEKLKSFPQTDQDHIAAIGYCFGGYVALNAAKEGAELSAVVSFHGGLSGPAPDQKKLKAPLLICHGADDEFENPHVATFKQQMDAIGADYQFIVYPNATHAFTNPAATEYGKKFNMPIAYNEEADKASWKDMKNFIKKFI